MPPRLMDSAAATGRAVGAIIDCLASLTGRSEQPQDSHAEEEYAPNAIRERPFLYFATLCLFL